MKGAKKANDWGRRLINILIYPVLFLSAFWFGAMTKTPFPKPYDVPWVILSTLGNIFAVLIIAIMGCIAVYIGSLVLMGVKKNEAD